ncbi:MAG: glycerol-3-phosphate 1-O-acyltransferase PlsY [Verrucomicrobia bacterium]|nr:glycerol-3-phosphate 1-O-acyltransferase PlsY [Verrucomicrobiota bacterium]
MLSYLVIIGGAYLLGSIPTGYLVAQAKGIDIRSVGSGNIGATNVFRILGVPAGILVLVMDGLKGFAACTWFVDLVLRNLPAGSPHEETCRILAGIAAVLGHNYTCWLRFRGGKGIATSAGVLAALVPWALIIIAALWGLLFVVSGFVSLGSVAASAALPLASWITGESLTMILVTLGLALLAIYKHRANIRRLLHGTEHRIRLKKEGAS